MIRYLLTFILCLFTTSIFAEAKSVGVVMSGGGAKGLYHIGVLESLERSGVPIDYVAGTSMGAIIAGLYAAGYSPEQMRALAESGELERWASGKIDANYGVLFRRGSTLRNNDPTVTLRVNPTKSGTKGASKEGYRPIPKSVISTTQIDMAISELFTPASTVADGDFNNLMVPFLCVASDVANSKKVVINSGDLAEAIRATMALPIAFKPIVKESGEILYDGGIQDNFPWRSMVEHFAPDVIIGSVCATDEWAESEKLSLLDQVFLLAMNKTDYNLPENGVKIARDVPSGLLDFNDPQKTIDLGRDDTLLKIDEIETLLGQREPLSEEYYNERRSAFNAQQHKLIFDSYNVSGLNSHQEDYVKRYISTSSRQQRFGAKREREMDFTELKRSLFSVLSTGDYSTNLPKIEYDSISDRYDFTIEMEHKPSLELSLGGNLSSTPFNQLYIGAKYTSIDRVARSLFSELYLGPVYTTGRLGYRVDFYHIAPIFIDTYFNFAVKNLTHGNFCNLTPITNTMGVKSSDYLLSLGIGAPILRRSQIILRGNGGVEQFDFQSNNLEQYNSSKYTFENSRFKYISGKAEIERSTIDNIHNPSKGSLLSISAIGVYGSESSYANEYNSKISKTDIYTAQQTSDNEKFYERHIWVGMKINYIDYLNIAPKERMTLGINLDAVYTTIPNMYSSTARQMMLPAYQPIPHMQMVYMPEFSAPRYIGVGVNSSIKIWRELSLRLEGYVMARDKLNSENSTIEKNKRIEEEYIFQSSLVYNTPFGPLSLAATKYGIDSWKNTYLTFNFGYTIFAPKGTFY